MGILPMSSSLNSDKSKETAHGQDARETHGQDAHATNNALSQYDAVLSIACGVGVGFMAEQFPTVRVLPGLDTTFYGANTAPGTWAEYCHGCGDCVLGWTGGVCPIARCSKSIMNGPCGGSQDGRCEINADVPCGWQLIYDRLKAQGRLELLDEVIPPKDWKSGRDGGPRKQTRPDLMKEAADGK